MKMVRSIFAALVALIVASTSAQAASCYWVGGTGTFSTSNTASWASSSGGAGGTCAATGGVPKQAGDTANFDALSGGGIVSVDSSLNGTTLTGINATTFTGTLDFSAGNPSLTITNSFLISGTSTRTVNLGSGTFTFVAGNANVFDNSISTNLTLVATSATLVFSALSTGSQTVNLGGGQTYGTITISARPNGTSLNFNSGAAGTTIGTLNITGPAQVNFSNSANYNITNGFNWSGSSPTAPLILVGTPGGTGIRPSVASSIDWAVLRGITFSVSAVSATNSWDAGGVSGATITPPSTGGGRVIGG